MAKLRAAVVGVGSIGDVHLAGYASARRDVMIQALCDTNPARLRAMGEKYGVPEQHRYRDFHQMISREPLDVLSVCTPNVYHYEQAHEALRRGIATLVEKPVTLRLEEARHLLRIATKGKVPAMVAFSHRFVRMNMVAKKLLEKGDLGAPFMIRVRYAHGGPYPGWAQSDWFYKRRLAGGGALLDMGIHAIDICHYFIGPISRVGAHVRTLRKSIEVDDNAVLAVDFGSQKCMGTIECGWTSPAGFVGVEIYGDEGALVLDLIHGPRWLRGKIHPDGKVESRPCSLKVPDGPSHWPLQMQEWIRFLRGKSTLQPLPTLADGVNALAVALAATRSAREGRIAVVRR